MVFPNVQVRMRLFDKLLIGVPALISGVIVIVTKLLATFGLLLLLLGFWLGTRDTRAHAEPGRAGVGRCRPASRSAGSWSGS